MGRRDELRASQAQVEQLTAANEDIRLLLLEARDQVMRRDLQIDALHSQTFSQEAAIKALRDEVEQFRSEAERAQRALAEIADSRLWQAGERYRSLVRVLRGAR